MADHVITLKISEQVYEYARRLAQTTSQSIEVILQQRLEDILPLPLLPPDEEAELAALRLLSDEVLWTLAAEQMPHVQQERLTTLLSLNKHNTMSDAEQKEMDDLLQRGDKLMVRKAEAAGILTERGYKVSPKDLASSHHE